MVEQLAIGDFYGRGSVTPAASPPPAIDAGWSGFAFELLQQGRVWFVLAFPNSLEAEPYAELGNILASRLGGGAVSPPRTLSPGALRRLAESAPVSAFTFNHHTPAGVVTLAAWVFANEIYGGQGNA